MREEWKVKVPLRFPRVTGTKWHLQATEMIPAARVPYRYCFTQTSLDRGTRRGRQRDG